MRKLILTLSCLLFFSPAYPREPLKFDTFLPKFRALYSQYHFGEAWPRQKVDKIAARIWSGSGEVYELASITACQGIFETHYNIESFVYGHRGHCGMRTATIIAEGVRTGLIKKGDQEGADWLLRQTRKDTGLADKLAASRFSYLATLCGSWTRALRVWVRGPLRSQSPKDKEDSLNYANGVLSLRNKMF